MALDLRDLGCTGENRVWRRLRHIQAALGHASDVTKQIRDSGTCKSRADMHRGTALNPALERMVPILSAMLPRGVNLHLRLAPDLPTAAMDSVQLIRAKLGSRAAGLRFTLRSTIGKDEHLWAERGRPNCPHGGTGATGDPGHNRAGQGR